MADHPREMDFAPVDMTSLVIVGNKATYIDNGLMTPARLRAVNHGDVAYRGHQRCAGDLPAAGRRRRATPCRWRPTGARLAGDIRGQIRCGRMEWQQRVAQSAAHPLGDASHPYAEVVSQNIVRACASVGVLLSRYQRPEQLSDLRHPLLTWSAI